MWGRATRHHTIAGACTSSSAILHSIFAVVTRCISHKPLLRPTNLYAKSTPVPSPHDMIVYSFFHNRHLGLHGTESLVHTASSSSPTHLSHQAAAVTAYTVSASFRFHQCPTIHDANRCLTPSGSPSCSLLLFWSARSHRSHPPFSSFGSRRS